jgi:pimeloyl-ACP methyl ester carboxylesterase
MAHSTFLPGITSSMVKTPRLTSHMLTSGPENGAPVVFVHGNVSSSVFWEETMLALPAGFRGIAVDLRGFGDSETLPVDATRGLCDYRGRARKPPIFRRGMNGLRLWPDALAC